MLWQQPPPPLPFSPLGGIHAHPHRRVAEEAAPSPMVRVPSMPPPLPPDAAPIANPMTLKFAGIEATPPCQPSPPLPSPPLITSTLQAGVMKKGRGGPAEPMEQLSLSKRNLKDRLRRARMAASGESFKEHPV
jgi:hypothetical protein